MCVCVCVSMVIIVVGGTYIIANIYAIPIPYANFTHFVHIAHAAVIQSHKTSHLVEFEMSNLVFVWTIIQNVEVQSTWNKQCECASYRNLMQNHHMQKQSAPKTFAFCIDNEPWPEHKRFTIMFHVCIRCVRVRVRWPYYTLNVAHWLAQPDRVCRWLFGANVVAMMQRCIPVQWHLMSLVLYEKAEHLLIMSPPDALSAQCWVDH